jgi:hypothetical protein
MVAIVSEGAELSSSRADVVLQAIQQSAVFIHRLGRAIHVREPSFARANRAADSTDHESVQRNT